MQRFMRSVGGVCLWEEGRRGERHAVTTEIVRVSAIC